MVDVSDTTAAVTGTNKQILGKDAAKISDLTESIAYNASITIDYSERTKIIALGGAMTIAFNASFPNGGKVELWFLRSGAGSITWPTVRWDGGSAPTITTTNTKYSVVVIRKIADEYFGTLAISEI
jgi:hypothetical protein